MLVWKRSRGCSLVGEADCTGANTQQQHNAPTFAVSCVNMFPEPFWGSAPS